MLREVELDEDGVQRMHSDDGGAGVEVLANAGLANAEDAVEGGGELFPGEEGERLFDGGGGLAEFALSDVNFGWGEGVFGLECAFAGEFKLSEIASSFNRVELGKFLVCEKVEDAIAFLDDLSRLKVDVGNDAGEIRGKGGSLNGLDGADGRKHGGPTLFFDFEGGDSDGRRGKRFAHGDVR